MRGRGFLRDEGQLEIEAYENWSRKIVSQRLEQCESKKIPHPKENPYIFFS
jgi:hypothetical protein